MTNRFVFDTNTLISALLFKNSTPRKAFDKALETGKILISLEVVSELNDVSSFALLTIDQYMTNFEKLTPYVGVAFMPKSRIRVQNRSFRVRNVKSAKVLMMY